MFTPSWTFIRVPFAVLLMVAGWMVVMSASGPAGRLRWALAAILGLCGLGLGVYAIFGERLGWG